MSASSIMNVSRRSLKRVAIFENKLKLAVLWSEICVNAL